MPNKKLSWMGLICALLFAVGALADGLPRAQPQEVGFSPERLAYIDKFYEEKVKKGDMAGVVVLVSRHGKIAHLSAVGYADLQRKQKLQTDTIFRLYSMTKPVAATALTMLYEEGKFQLKDPVSKYIPEFANLRVLRTPESPLDDTAPLASPPTMQDLYRHTAGFGHGGEKNSADAEYQKQNLFSVDLTLAEMIGKLAKIPLIVQPGTRYIYSVSQDVQARLVEILSGMAFDEFLEKRLFKPLGMRDAGFWLTPDKANRLAAVHWSKNGRLTTLDEKNGYPVNNGFLVQPRLVNSYTVNHKRKGGSYGLVSTAEDYWRFAQAMGNGGQFEGARILSPQTVQFIARDHLAYAGIKDLNGMGWGLGFAVVLDPVGVGYTSTPGTFYWAGAAGTQFWIDPKNDLVVVALTQHMGAPGAAPFASEIRALVYGALMESR